MEGLAEQRPLVLVFEDVQWADDALLDFVDYLVDWAGDVPLLVLCTARLELLDRRPGWGGGKANATALSLSALSDDETARLLGSVLERSVLPAEEQQELLARAGGNPLYAEQFARMRLERGDRHEFTLPETVQGIIAASINSDYRRDPPRSRSQRRASPVGAKEFAHPHALAHRRGLFRRGRIDSACDPCHRGRRCDM